jgi:hypothetical protein
MALGIWNDPNLPRAHPHASVFTSEISSTVFAITMVNLSHPSINLLHPQNPKIFPRYRIE